MWNLYNGCIICSFQPFLSNVSSTEHYHSTSQFSFTRLTMEKFSNTRYERLQSDDESEENVDEDLPPQVHITAPGGDGNGRNGEILNVVSKEVVMTW